MASRAFKQKLGRREPLFGLFAVEFDTPGMGHIVAQAGADFVYFDMEHSGFGIESVKRSVRYYEAAGVPVIVRPPSDDYHHIARVLDAGADAVCLPMVATAEQAAKIVTCAKYPPMGARGVAIGIAHDRYRGVDAGATLRAANRDTAVVCMVETVEGVENVDAIAAVDGVDMLWIGGYDLSASLGFPGQLDHKSYLAAVKKVVRACAANGKSLGILDGSLTEAVGHLRDGFNAIIYSADSWLLRDALKAAIDTMRGSLAKGGKKKIKR